MVWALTLPVCILVGLFQYGVITGNNLLAFFGREEPYFLLTFLLYVTIGIIIIFVLFAQKRIIHAQAAQAQQQEIQRAQGQSAQAAQAPS
jgi:hypothetical protein